MNSQLEQLGRLGFTPYFLESMPESDLAGKQPARVLAVYKERFIISDGEHEIPAELVGKLLYNAGSPLDLPTTGDWVLASIYDGQSFAIIHEVLPRRTYLKRKAPGRTYDFQLIAANIDTAFFMMALDENFSLRRLERYLVMVHEGGVEPVVLLSKSDLLDQESIKAHIEDILRINPDLEVHAFSNLSENGFSVVENRLQSGKTFCLLGSSGIGKTTFINNLLGSEKFSTAEVRAYDGKGRHTTTTRQLLVLENGAMIVDTPGMRELGNFAVQDGLEDTFEEILELSENCQFRDCTHTSEPGCAVKQAVEEGRLSEARYKNFLQLKSESSYGELSYQERRQKDRDRGKYYKSVMKQKKHKR